LTGVDMWPLCRAHATRQNPMLGQRLASKLSLSLERERAKLHCIAALAW
jgi:hypothetical protein